VAAALPHRLVQQETARRLPHTADMASWKLSSINALRKRTSDYSNEAYVNKAIA
jgi:hypothetical protein